MLRRIWKWVLTAVMLLNLVLPVSAAEGSISLQLNVGDLPVLNGAFTLYRVGIRVSDGYRITEDFGGGFVREEDALSPHLAQWLSEHEGDPTRTLLLDVDGNAVFSQLGEGLYLVVQSEMTDGFYPIQPFLLSVPNGTRWEYPVTLDPLPRVAPSPETGEEGLLLRGLLGMMASAVGLLLCWQRRPWNNLVPE